jgi:hypothetical protein
MERRVAREFAIERLAIGAFFIALQIQHENEWRSEV